MALPEEEQPTNPYRGGMSQNVVRSQFQTESDPVVVPETEDQLGGGDPSKPVEGGERKTGKSISDLEIAEPKKAEKPYTMKGDIYAPTPQAELDAKQTAEKNIFEARQRAMIADYQAAGYSEKVMRDMIAIGERDAVLQRQLPLPEGRRGQLPQGEPLQLARVNRPWWSRSGCLLRAHRPDGRRRR
jgi:hypothetical protein